MKGRRNGPDRHRRPSPELPLLPPGSSSCGRDTPVGSLETRRAGESLKRGTIGADAMPAESRCAAHSLIARTPKAMAISIPSANDTQPAAVSPSTSPLSRPSAIDRSVREGSPWGPQSYEARERWPRLSASRKGGRHAHACPFQRNRGKSARTHGEGFLNRCVPRASGCARDRGLPANRDVPRAEMLRVRPLSAADSWRN